MLKDPIAWLVLRVIGLLLLGQTLLQVLDLMAQLLPTEGPGRPRTEVGLILLKTVLSGGLAWYFLRRGKLVHKLLVYERR